MEEEVPSKGGVWGQLPFIPEVNNFSRDSFTLNIMILRKTGVGKTTFLKRCFTTPFNAMVGYTIDKPFTFELIKFTQKIREKTYSVNVFECKNLEGTAPSKDSKTGSMTSDRGVLIENFLDSKMTEFVKLKQRDGSFPDPVIHACYFVLDEIQQNYLAILKRIGRKVNLFTAYTRNNHADNDLFLQHIHQTMANSKIAWFNGSTKHIQSNTDKIKQQRNAFTLSRIELQRAMAKDLADDHQLRRKRPRPDDVRRERPELIREKYNLQIKEVWTQESYFLESSPDTRVGLV